MDISSKLIIRLTVLYFALFLGNAFAQAFSKDLIMADLTLRFLDHVSWENEEQSDSFRIAFVGADPPFYDALKAAAENRMIRNKDVRVVAIESFEDLANFHVLVVAMNTRLPFSEVALKARGTHTLVVSKQQKDQIYIMINFLESVDSRISFELNRANLLLEGLSINDDILLLGGNELDVAERYREMEENLSLLVEKLDSTEQQQAMIRLNEDLLSSQQEELGIQQLSIDQQSSTIREQERQLYFALIATALFLVTIFIYRLYRIGQDRKRASQELKKYSILLEKTIAEKTLEMERMTKKLIRQEKLATIGQISASIAHELRNPLGAINQAVFYIKRKISAPQQRVTANLELIETEIKTADRVISDLLEVTQIKEPRRQRLNLRDIASDAAQRCALDDSVRLTIELNPDPFWIWADPLQMRQVLMNLFTNASQACSGSGVITMTAKYLPVQRNITPQNGPDDRDLECQIEIRDNGSGMDAKSIDKAFELLYTTKAKGTGLGLSICRQIVEKHGGSIHLISPGERGTMVQIRLPMHDPSGDEFSDHGEKQA